MGCICTHAVRMRYSVLNGAWRTQNNNNPRKDKRATKKKKQNGKNKRGRERERDELVVLNKWEWTIASDAPSESHIDYTIFWNKYFQAKKTATESKKEGEGIGEHKLSEEDVLSVENREIVAARVALIVLHWIRVALFPDIESEYWTENAK